MQARQMNVVLKSGTNDFHGEPFLFQSQRSAGLAVACARAHQSETGHSQQPVRLLRRRTDHQGTRPSSSWRARRRSLLPTIPSLTTEPSAAWVTQAEGVLARYSVPVNPVSLNLLSIWPASVRTGPATTNNYLANGQNNYNSFNGVMKIDHRFNEKQLDVRALLRRHRNPDRGIGSRYPELLPDRAQPYAQHRRGETAVLSPRMVNVLTLGVNYFYQSFNDADTGFNPIALGLNTGATSPVLIGSPKLTITGFDYVGATSPEARTDTTGHLTDTLSYNVGRHAFIFGGEFRRAVLDVGYDINERGSFTFDGTRGPWSTDPTVTGDLRTPGRFPRRLSQQFQWSDHRARSAAAPLLPELFRPLGRRHVPHQFPPHPELRRPLHLSGRTA